MTTGEDRDRGEGAPLSPLLYMSGCGGVVGGELSAIVMGDAGCDNRRGGVRGGSGVAKRNWDD